jgi:hypothetical protein
MGYYLNEQPTPRTRPMIETHKEKAQATSTIRAHQQNVVYSSNRKISDILNNTFLYNKPVFVVGGGYSITNFDFDVLSRHKIITINRAWEYCRSDIWYGMDTPYIEQMKHGELNAKSKYGNKLYEMWQKMPSIKTFACPNSSYAFDDSVYLVRKLKTLDLPLDICRGIYAGNNSGTGAISLAASLGARAIYLLGFDMKMGIDENNNKRSHFHSGYPESDIDRNAKFEKYKQDIGELANFLRIAEVRVYNLNPDSALTCFPFLSLGEALR